VNDRIEDKRRETPHVLLILLITAAILAAMTWVVPPGRFMPDPGGMIDLSSFQLAAESGGVTLFSGDGISLLGVLFEGLVAGDRYGATVGIMAFLLIIGGVFGVIQRTGAVDAGITALVDRVGHSPRLMLVILFATFSAGGAVFGMGEEAIAFAVLLVPLMRQLGYPAAVAVLLTYGATQIGFGTSWMNPFSVIIAQGIAEVPPLSGAGFRIVVWLAFTALAGSWTVWFAHRHRTEPGAAFPSSTPAAAGGMRGSDYLVLVAVALTLAWIIWGVTIHQYYLPEIATQFFTLGLVVAAIARLAPSSRLGANDLVEAFVDGAAQLLPAALVVAMAKGLVLMLGGSDPTEPAVMNTLLYASATMLTGLPEMASAWLMLVVQSLINLVVTSGSGQAALTMPIMAPLSDLLGVTRQTSVLAFQLGDGLTNLIAPTSAALMGTLGVARVDWLDWLRLVWPLIAGLFLLALATMSLAVVVGL
jgi:uncharacterized ion transporter superfamily protein YfcC